MTAGPRLHPICEITVDLGASRLHGSTRDGERRTTPILGGTVTGISDGFGGAGVRNLAATVIAGGGDRQLVRPDGTVEIDARYDAETQTGAFVSIHAQGVRCSDEHGTYFWVSIRFETSAVELAELERTLCVASGVREANQVRHTVYRVDSV